MIKLNVRSVIFYVLISFLTIIILELIAEKGFSVKFMAGMINSAWGVVITFLGIWFSKKDIEGDKDGN